VRAQYLAKADEFAARAFGENELEMSRVQLYYANCADQIQGLIDQEGA
jgi:antirestriction protein ArdC